MWLIFFQQIKSSICLLRGKIYDALDNRTLATYSYKEALKLDVYCFEAFDLLTSHHMLTAQEGLETQVFVCLAQLIFFLCFSPWNLWVNSRLCTDLDLNRPINFLSVFKYEVHYRIQYWAVPVAVRILRDCDVMRPYFWEVIWGNINKISVSDYVALNLTAF